MDNKKKYFIAIILFIFIGLMVFTFANPGKDNYTEKLDGNGSGNTTTTTKPSGNTDTTETDENETGNNATGGNTSSGRGNSVTQAASSDNSNANEVSGLNGSPESKNNTLADVEALVKKAEESYDNGDYQNALNALENLENSEDKEALENRLKNVKEGIDLKALVESLVNKVEGRKSYEDMTSARTDNEENKITERVGKLEDENLKSSLQSQLDTITSLLNDDQAPKVKVDDGDTLEEGATLTTKGGTLKVEDDNDVTIEVVTIKDDEGGVESFKAKEYTLPTVSGTYEITVTDAAFNKTTLTIVIDADPAEVTRVKVQVHGKEVPYANATDKLMITVQVNEEIKNAPVVKIGNKIIDVKPTLETISTGYRYTYRQIEITEDMNLNSGDKISVTVSGIEDLVGNPTEEITSDGTEYNEVPVVYDIDSPKLNFGNGFITNAYTIEATDTNLDYITVKNTLTGKEEKITATEGKAEFKLPEEEADNVKYDVVAVDKAGNKAYYKDSNGKMVYYLSLYHDNKKPEIYDVTKAELKELYPKTGVTLQASDGSLKKVEVKKGEEVTTYEFKNNYTANKVVSDEIKLTEDGTYTITATDRFGNTETKTITVDAKDPKIKAFGISTSGKVVGDTSYVTVKQRIRSTIKFDEELAKIPTFVLVDRATEKEVFTFEEVTCATDEDGLYACSIVYTLTGEDKFADGTYTIKVKNIQDKAGNAIDDIDHWTLKQNVIVVDTQAPVMTLDKLENGFTNDKDLTITDANEFTSEIEYNGKVVKSEIKSDLKEDGTYYDRYGVYSGDGEYKVRATDKAGNTTEVTFVYDSIPPQLAIADLKNGITKNPGFKPNDANLEKIEVYRGTELLQTYSEEIFLDKRTGLYMCFCDLSELGSGEYTIVAYDKAGNKNQETYIYDAIAPEVKINGEEPKSLYNNIESITSEEGATIVVTDKEGNILDNYSAMTDGEYTVTVTDVAGNETKVTIEIDKTEPIITWSNGTNVGNGNIVNSQDESNPNYATSINVADKNNSHMTIYNSITKETTTVEAKEDGTLTFDLASIEGIENADNLKLYITAYDKAGNVKTRDGEAKGSAIEVYIDNKKPVIAAKGSLLNSDELVVSGETYKGPVYVKITDGSLTKITATKDDVEYGTEDVNPNYDPNKVMESNLTYEEEGTYKIVAVDRVGNEYTLEFTIDKTPVKMTASTIWANVKEIVKDGKTYYYANDSKNILPYIVVAEELGENPVFTLKDSKGTELVIPDEYVTKTFNEEEGTYKYGASYPVSEATTLADGEISVKITNIKDKLGVEGVISSGEKLDYVDYGKLTNNNRIVVIDRDNPDISENSLRIVSNGNDKKDKIDGKTVYYANNRIRIYANFNEELRNNPKFTISDNNNHEISGELKYNDNAGRYEADIYLNKEETKLEDGLVNLRVYGYEDLAGNEGVELTNADINTYEGGVVVERTAPSLSIMIDGEETLLTPDNDKASIYIDKTVVGKAVEEHVPGTSIGVANKIVGDSSYTDRHQVNIFNRAQSYTKTITVYDELDNEHTYTIYVYPKEAESNKTQALKMVQPGDTVDISGATITEDVTIKANDVTIIGDAEEKIQGKLVIDGDDVTLDHVNVESTGHALEVNGDELTIVGGSYKVDDHGYNNIQGEGAIRVMNATAVSIHGAKLNGGIHLLDYEGTVVDIAGNEITYDYNGDVPLVGILITTNNNLDKTAQQIKDANTFHMDTVPNGYYVAIQEPAPSWANKDVVLVSGAAAAASISTDEPILNSSEITEDATVDEAEVISSDETSEEVTDDETSEKVVEEEEDAEVEEEMVVEPETSETKVNPLSNVLTNIVRTLQHLVRI